jgi:hypothetical protein
VDVVGGTFDQGDGTATGAIYVEGGALDYSGSGASTIHARGAVSLTGSIGVDQTLLIESLSDCDPASDTTVSAPSLLSFGSIELTNAATSCDPGTAALSVAGTFTNRGTFTSQPGTLGGPRLVQGTVLNKGTIDVVAGSDLTLAGALTNASRVTLAPGDILAVADGYTQAATGLLTVQVSSDGIGSVDGHDGPASLAGNLAVAPIGGFVPALGSTFGVLEYASRTGMFGSVLGTAIGDGNAYVLQYDPTGATLVVRKPTIRLSPNEGAPGSQFTVTGQGFSPNETVGITFKSFQLVQATADASGSFFVNETVPDVTASQYLVRAKGLTSSVSASATFVVKRRVLNHGFRLIGTQLLDTDPSAEYSTTSNADLAMDPNDTSHLISTYQEGQFPDEGAIDAGFATSLDDGYTWTSGNMPGLTRAVGGVYPRAANPRVAVGLNGAAYVVSQLLDPVKCKTAIAFSTSRDNGITWSNPSYIREDASCAVQNDMTGIAVDTFPSSPYFGRIYVVWDVIKTSGQPIMLAYSSDGGATWSGPVQVSPDGVSGVAPTPLVQPDGKLTVYYPQPAASLETVQTSANGGASFAAPVTVYSFDAADPPGILAGNAQGIGDAAVDPTNGDLYVVWPDRRFDPWGMNAVVMSLSTDGGVTWQGPLLLSGHPISPIDRFTPGIGAFGGFVAVTWYHWSQGASGVRLNRGFTYSSNGGRAWSKTLEIDCGHSSLDIDLDYSALVNGLHYFGFYQSVVTTPTDAHPVWTVASAADTSYYQVEWTATMTYLRDGSRSAPPRPPSGPC